MEVLKQLGKKPGNEPWGMSLSLFSDKSFVLHPHKVLSSTVTTLKLKKMEDSYSWSLGVDLGYIKH